MLITSATARNISLRNPLTTQDRKLIGKDIVRWGIIHCGVAGLLGLIVFFSSMEIIAKLSSYLVMLWGLAFSWIIVTRRFWTDLKIGQKDVITGIVEEKDNSQPYAWTGNLGLDEDSITRTGKGKMVYQECRLKINNRWYVVSCDMFDDVHIGDNLELYFTARSHQMLGYKRV